MSEPLTTAGQTNHGPPDEVVTYALRGCQYPGCGKDTRAYIEFEGLSYCEDHIGLVKSGAKLTEIFSRKPVFGTGEP